MDTYKKYSARRDELGLTDYAVAKKTDLWQSVFTDWKSGRSKPKVDKLLLIAKALDTNLEYFLNE